MATYQALYRKYRPQTFDDVLGQMAVTQTMKTQLSSGKMGHAYLFTGSRGTGKTTCARILAKAVNCLHPLQCVRGLPSHRQRLMYGRAGDRRRLQQRR